LDLNREQKRLGNAPSAPTSGPDPGSLQQRLNDIAHQSSVSFVGTIFTLALGYVFRVYLARMLGA
jgi:hypothetical protein